MSAKFEILRTLKLFAQYFLQLFSHFLLAFLGVNYDSSLVLFCTRQFEADVLT